MQYGLIGEKLGHSFSKEVHSLLGDYDYQLKEISQEELPTFIKSKAFKGINVTIPYKQIVIPMIDHLDASARKIGAVNTIVNKNGVLYGYNTDYLGVQSLLNKLKIDVKNKKVLILGNGATCKTVLSVLTDNGAGEIVIASRSKTNKTVDYLTASTIHNDSQIIFNTTPVGMYPNSQRCPIDLSAFNKLQAVLDVMYNPICTNLVLSAKQMGVPSIGGLYMLVSQAVYSSCFFFDKQPNPSDIDAVYNRVLKDKANIVLTGMPSCGKSTVGKLLAQKLSKTFIDTDDCVETALGCKISSIINNKGESFFRQVESEQVQKVSLLNGCVIATGGGSILNANNVKNLKQNGIIFFIDRPLNMLLATKDRPLTSSLDSLTKIYNQRRDIYLTTADKIIDGSLSVEDVVNIIIRGFEDETSSN